MRIITGSTGTTHVTSNDDGGFNQGIFGKGLIVLENGNQLSASIVDNNTIRMADGDLILQGRHALIAPNTTEDIIIETGAVGINRNDLIVARYVLDSATGYESITAEVLKGEETSGTAIDPEITTGDIRTGDMLVEAALYRVKIEGINIVALEPLFTVTEDIIGLVMKLQEENAKLNRNKSHVGMIIHSTTLDTMEKVIAIYGGTTWVKIEGQFLLGQSSTYAINSIGGSPTNTLSVANLPSHNHSIPALSGKTNNTGAHTHNQSVASGDGGTGFGNRGEGGLIGSLGGNTITQSSGSHEHTVATNANNTGYAGSGTPINNMPPYKTVYIWERTS